MLSENFFTVRHRRQRIGPRMETIAWWVQQSPGLTAHALAPAVYGMRRPTWDRVYAAFQRARRAGLVVARSIGARTVYDPPAKSDD